MVKKTFLYLSTLICAVCAFGQSPIVEIRSAGERKVANGETPESAKQRASYDAARAELLEAAARPRAVMT